jgi:hypothetical protein
MKGNLTGVWRGTRTWKADPNKSLSTEVLTINEQGPVIQGDLETKLVLPPTGREWKGVVSKGVGPGVTFCVNYNLVQTRYAVAVSDDGKRLTGTWESDLDHYGDCDFLRDVANDPAESVETAQSIEEPVPA